MSMANQQQMISQAHSLVNARPENRSLNLNSQQPRLWSIVEGGISYDFISIISNITRESYLLAHIYRGAKVLESTNASLIRALDDVHMSFYGLDLTLHKWLDLLKENFRNFLIRSSYENYQTFYESSFHRGVLRDLLHAYKQLISCQKTLHILADSSGFLVHHFVGPNRRLDEMPQFIIMFADLKHSTPQLEIRSRSKKLVRISTVEGSTAGDMSKKYIFAESYVFKVRYR
jgi:hypothetical protein